MFCKTFVTFASVSLAVSVVFAANTSRIEEDISQKNSTQKISWDQLQPGAVPSAETINAALRTELIDSSCGASDDADQSYDYEASANAVEINGNYVAYQISYDSYCGGAHPDAGTYNLTYNSKTGAKVDMDKEVPLQDASSDKVDWNAHDKYQHDLAEVMLSFIKDSKSDVLKDTECFDSLSDADTIDQIVNFWPTISGLGPDKKVITSISPPHAAAPCQFDLAVPLSAVDKFVAPNSEIREWLK